MPTIESSVASIEAAAAAPPYAGATAAPIRAEERISTLDSIRGFGLLGILLMNITFFGLPQEAYDFPVAAGGSTGWNLFTWCVITVIADGKMRAIFSLAFGASVYLLVDRLSRRGAALDAADIHYRRMLWLLLFGLIHAYVIWGGDILFIYAMLGLLLYPLRKLAPRALLIGAGALMLGLCANYVHIYVHSTNLHREYDQIQLEQRAGEKLSADQEDQKKEWEELVSKYYPTPDELKKETDAHLGSYAQLFAFRAKGVYEYHSHPIYDPWVWYDPLIMMLIGMALLKLGILNGSYPTRFYVWMAVLSFAVGLPAHLWSVWWPIKQHFGIDAWYSTGVAYNFSRFTALGYVALIILAIKAGVGRAATRVLASVGQMAFTNYILTSLICTTIFEGYGFGLFGKLQRYQLYAVVACVWLVILIVSPLWLRHFRFGPLEWLWRCLTYWKKQPLRRDKIAGTGAGLATGVDTL